MRVCLQPQCVVLVAPHPQRRHRAEVLNVCYGQCQKTGHEMQLDLRLVGLRWAACCVFLQVAASGVCPCHCRLGVCRRRRVVGLHLICGPGILRSTTVRHLIQRGGCGCSITVCLVPSALALFGHGLESIPNAERVVEGVGMVMCPFDQGQACVQQ